MKTRFLIFAIALLLPMQLVYAQPIPEPEPVCKGGTILTNGACVSADGSICGPGTTYQDGICVVDKMENSTKSSSGKWGGYQFTHLEIENIDGMLYYVSEPFALNSSVEKIIFHDVEFSPPYRYDPPRYVYSDVTFSDGTEETLRVLFDYPTFTEHVKPQAGFTETFDGIRFLVRVDLKELSPLKQIKSGIATDKIRCNDGLKLIYKYDEMPACVKPESIPKLAERGWISEIDEHSLLTFKKVLDSCANDSTKERMANPLRYSNGTHAFMNLGCDWKKIGVYVGDKENEN